MTDRTLVLDLDGTLVDSVPDLAAALNRLMQIRALATFSHAEVAAMVGDGAQVMINRAFAAHDRTPDPTALADFLADYTENAAVLTRPYPGVPETLHTLVADGWRLAVCTNKPERPARLLLEALNLAPLFAAIGGGDSFPTRKPNPQHLLATIHAAGGNPATSVMVGDHHNDLNAAAGAGIPAIFAAWGYGHSPPPGTISAARFADVPGLAIGLVK